MNEAVSRIALVLTRNRREGVPRAINLLKYNPVRGKEVTLKPNFNTADPFPASTHNETLRALVLTLREMGATRIILAERSGPANTRQVMEQKGIFQMGEELGFEVIDLDELGAEGWVLLHPEGSRGAVFTQEQIARAVELGLGAQSPAQIQFVTDDAAGEEFARRLEGILRAD